MALRYAGVAVAQREVVLRDKPAAFIALSAKATVPVLQLASGTVLEQSADIMRWALAQDDPAHWLENSQASEALITQNDTVFKPLLDRYKYANRHPELTPSQHLDACLAAHICALDAQLKSTPFLLGAQVRLADVALFPFVRQFAAVDAAWFALSQLHGVQRWLSELEGSALFESVMQKLPQWREGAPSPLL
jgi:glutathione S-transferase